jgi:hypothetical protein
MRAHGESCGRLEADMKMYTKNDFERWALFYIIVSVAFAAGFIINHLWEIFK